jgi:hypothetical protein
MNIPPDGTQRCAESFKAGRRGLRQHTLIRDERVGIRARNATEAGLEQASATLHGLFCESKCICCGYLFSVALRFSINRHSTGCDRLSWESAL